MCRNSPSCRSDVRRVLPVGWAKALAQLFNKGKLPTIYGYKTTEKKPLVPEKCVGTHYKDWHKEFPAKPIDEAETKLKFKDWELTERQCPALRIAIQKLAQARLGWEFDTIIMDPTVHELYVHSYTGDLDAAIFDDANPLVRWALETRNSMKACGAENIPSTKSARDPKD